MINIDGLVKRPSAVLLFAAKGLNVQKVRLSLSRLARLAYESFYQAVYHVFPWSVTLPLRKNKHKFRLSKK